MTKDYSKLLQQPKIGEFAGAWEYFDARGELSFVVTRYNKVNTSGKEEKEFRPWSFLDGRWIIKAPELRPLYNLLEIIEKHDALVIIVEGEKAAEAARRFFPHCVIVTSSFGSQAAHKTDWSTLAGRDTVVWPDNDEAGKKYASIIVNQLATIGAKSIRIVQLPEGLPPKWDLADLLPFEFQEKNLLDWVENAPLISTLANNEEINLANIVRQLAALSPIEYDRVRTRHAASLGIRRSVLDQEVKEQRIFPQSQHNRGGFDFPEIEPWPEPVDAAALFDEIATIIDSLVILSKHSKTAVTLWVLFTWVIDAFHTAPILAICSPEKRCGKTSLISAINGLVNKPLPAANITPAAMFRTIELCKPTLLIDEADTFLAGKDELRGIINSGHTRTTAFVIRSVGDEHEPKKFSTWGAKVIALIGDLYDTLRDRSIIIELRRKLKSEKVQKLRDVNQDSFEKFRSQLKRLADDSIQALSSLKPVLPDSLSDRGADNWEPLLAIAFLAGSRWQKKAFDAAIALSKEGPDVTSVGTEMLRDIKAAFEVLGDKISTVSLIDFLCRDEERPWVSWKRDKPITPNHVAMILKPFGIKSKTVRLDSYNTPKGYEISQFSDAFARYLEGGQAPAATTPQPTLSDEWDVAETVPNKSQMTAPATQESFENLACGAVAAKSSNGSLYEYEERAAIREFCGEQKRSVAESEAQKEKN